MSNIYGSFLSVDLHNIFTFILSERPLGLNLCCEIEVYRIKYKPTIPPSSTEFNKNRAERAQLLGSRRLLTAVTLLAVITCLFSLCQKPLSNMMLKGNSCASHIEKWLFHY